jgi:uncharacterized protein
MLGLSLGKLILLAIIIAVVWYGFKYMERVETLRRTQRREADRQRKSAPPGPRGIEAEDLVKCARCGAYVAAGSATHCGRPDCPWGR